MLRKFKMLIAAALFGGVFAVQLPIWLWGRMTSFAFSSYDLLPEGDMGPHIGASPTPSMPSKWTTKMKVSPHFLPAAVRLRWAALITAMALGYALALFCAIRIFCVSRENLTRFVRGAPVIAFLLAVAWISIRATTGILSSARPDLASLSTLVLALVVPVASALFGAATGYWLAFRKMKSASA
jgi:hypothetical protein